MKILHCIPSLSGGGAERQLALLAQGLSAAGVETHVAYLYPGPAFVESDWAGTYLHQLNPSSNTDLRIGRMLWALVRNTRPHLIQTWLTQMDVFGGLAAALSGVPCIISERSSDEAYRASWKHFLRARVGAMAASVVANSFSGLSYWLNKNQSEFNRVIRNAVNIENIQGGGGEALESRERSEAILYAGRYVEVKNLANLMQALSLVLKERPNAAAGLYGAGPQLGMLKEKNAVSGMGERIRINDFTLDLFDRMKEAMVFVSVSRYEGHPNTVVEAALARCPLVVSDIPAHREFLTTNSATFVPCDSSELIAAGIQSVLENYQVAKQKAEIAYRDVQRWTKNLMVDQHIRLYNEILNYHSQSARLLNF